MIAWVIVEDGWAVWECPGATRLECEATAALWRRHGIACEARATG
jgi:hypothetical protein